MKSFVKMSKYAGMREDLVQAGGGNSAVKLEAGKMVIKASGYQLADVTENEGYAIVDPRVIRDSFLNCEDIDLMTEKGSKDILKKAYIEGKKPSIETFLHSISGKYSLHTHPTVVNVLACRKDGEQILEELFKDSLIVPYATPGVELAKTYFKYYKNYKEIHKTEPKVVFLLNHGLLVSAESAEEVIQLTETVTKKIETYLEMDYSSYHYMMDILELYHGEGIIWKVNDYNVIKVYKNLGGLWKHYFCPDCVVFLGKEFYEIKEKKIKKDKFQEFVAHNGEPVIIAYENLLYIHAESVKKALEIQSVLSFSAQVMFLNKQQECNLLSESEKDFLLDWDAEKYRKNIK